MFEAILLSGLRIAAFMLFFPVFGQLRLPLSLRLAMTAVVCLMLWPNFLSNVFSVESPDWWSATDTLIVYGVFEIALGLMLALLSGAVFLATEWLAALLFALLKCGSWDAEDAALFQGAGSDSMHLRLPLCLLTAAVLLHSHAFDLLLVPLAQSFLTQPVRNIPGMISLAGSLVPTVFTFSVFLAVPFFALSLLVDVLFLALHRLCAPYVPVDLVDSLRLLVVVVALSLGIGFIEASSSQFGEYWYNQELR